MPGELVRKEVKEPLDIGKPLVIGVATRYTRHVANWEASLKKHGWAYRVAKLGTPWTGFHTKMEGFIEELQRVDPRRLVILTDTSDVLAVKTPTQFLELWTTHYADKQLVVGAESYCAHHNCKMPSKYWDAQQHVSPYKYVNSGLMAGYAGYLLDMWRTIRYTFEAHDDQLGTVEFIEKQNDLSRVHLDSGSILFYNDNWGGRATLQDTTLHDPLTGPTAAAFYHFPGMSFSSYFALRKNYTAVGKQQLGPYFLKQEPGVHDEKGYWTLVVVAALILVLGIIVFIVLSVRVWLRMWHRPSPTVTG